MQADRTDLPPPPELAKRPPADGPRPRVSVVLTTYRRPRLIGETIASVLGQTFSDFELLVRDDGKEGDGTEEAVARVAAGDPRVRYHRNEKNLRMPENLNAGIRDSVGDYVSVAHDHDLFAPGYLEGMVRLLDRHPSALYVHCAIDVVDQEGRPAGAPRPESGFAELTPGHDWLGRLLEEFPCQVCALSMVRREAHERHGLYHPAYGFISDVELWMRLAEAGDVAYAKERLVRIRTREDEHFSQAEAWPILVNLFSIHKRYVRRAYRGIERLKREASVDLRADLLLLRELASRLKRRRGVGFGDARSGLRAVAGPVGRTLAMVLR